MESNNSLVVMISMFLVCIHILAFISGIYCIIVSGKLAAYLKKNKYERWRELTTVWTPVGNIGPGGFSSINSIRYIYSDIDNEDEDILRLKDSCKIGFSYFIVLATSSLACMGILAIISALMKK